MLKFLFLFLISFNCIAQDQWTESDSYRETAYVVVTAVDWNQTLQINSHGLRESNVILGSHPSDSRINTLIPASMFAHYYIATLLPTEYRKAWQYTWIGIETGYIFNNFSLGLKIKF